MAPINRFPAAAFLALTTIPALLVGGTLWWLSTLIPGCEATETARLPSPDRAFDLVVYSSDCGSYAAPNSQAALIPLGDTLPEDASSFAAIAGSTALVARWDGQGAIELVLPPSAEVHRRDDAVAGIAVRYR